MDKEAVQIVMDKLEVLASKLGVTGEYMFGVYVKQAFITGISNIALTILIVLAVIGLSFWGFKRIPNDDVEEGEEACLIILSVVTIIFLAVCFFYKIPESVTCFYNPEYYALKELLNVLN